jgi:hypothetical protein
LISQLARLGFRESAMFVKCPNCGLQTYSSEYCDHCRYRLSTDTRPATTAAPPSYDQDEDIPMVHPAAAPSPKPAEAAAPPSQRVFARRAESAPPRRLWPWVAAAAGGVVLFVGVAVGIAEMVARSSGTSLFGARPTVTSVGPATVRDTEADDAALKKANAPPLSKETIEAMLKLADAKGDETLIDLGCGNGRLAVEAGEKGLKVNAYDSDLALVKMAKRLLVERPDLTHVKFEQANNVLQVNLKNANIVILAHPKRWGTVHEVGKLLKPRFTEEGLRLVTTEPIFASWSAPTKTLLPSGGQSYTLFLYEAPLK